MQAMVKEKKKREIADELIAQHPEFKASIEQAHKQKAEGQIKTLEELRRKYASE